MTTTQPTDADPVAALSLQAVRQTRAALGERILATPVHRWKSDELARRVGAETEVHLKLELLQVTGTFKVRGALNVMGHLSAGQLQRGITAISAGNHAIAAAYAAREAGTSAKVVMISTANPFRIERCRAYGAELIMVDDAAEGFELVERIGHDEGRALVHPFEGPLTSLGTATVGMELCTAVPSLDAVIVPIGGGGLSSGVAAAVKLMQPDCAVYGVEPRGAATMTESFAAGEPARLGPMHTIADSLAAPHTGPTAYALCRRYIDEIVLLDDHEFVDAMDLAFRDLKLALEPAGAAATAALLGPLRERLAGRRVGVIVCGTNIDLATFTKLLRDHGPTRAETRPDAPDAP